MPRLPIIVESQPLQVTRGPQPNAAAWSAPDQALEQLGGNVENVGLMFALAKAKARKAAAELEMGTALEEMKVRYADAVVKTKLDESVTPQNYSTVLDQELVKIRTDAKAKFGALFPEMLPHFAAKTAQFAATQAVDSRYEGIKRQVEKNQYTTMDRMDKLSNELGGTDDPARQSEIMNQVNSDLKTMSENGQWTAEATIAAKRRFFMNAEETQVLRSYATGTPEERVKLNRELEDPAVQSHMPFTKRMQLSETLQTRAVTEQNRAQAEAIRAATEAKNQEGVAILIAHGDPNADQAGLLSRLKQSATDQNWTVPEYERIHDILTKPPHDIASDPQIYARAVVAIHSPRPTMTLQQLGASFDAFRAGLPGINTKDYISLADKLTGRLDHNTAEARTVGMQQFHEAATELRAGLAIPEIVSEKIEPRRLTMYSDLLTRLADRSTAFGGREDARAIVKTFIVEGQRRLELDTSGRISDLSAQIRFQGQGDLDAAKAQGFGANKPLKSPQDYDQQRRLMIDRQRLYEEQQPAQKQGPVKPPEPPKPGFFGRFFNTPPDLPNPRGPDPNAPAPGTGYAPGYTRPTGPPGR